MQSESDANPTKKANQQKKNQEISVELLKTLKPADKPYEIYDSELKGFILRVQPSGVMSYILRFAEGKRITLGRTTFLSPAKARDKARKNLAAFVLTGDDPMEAKKAARAHTLKSFLEEEYSPWSKGHHRHSAETVRKIESFLPELGSKRLGEITAWAIEKHRSKRLKNGTSPSTTNRELDTLRAALNKAVEWKHLKVNPIAGVKRIRVDDSAKVRYLSEDERRRLDAALDSREARRRKARVDFNQWRTERGYKPFRDYGSFTDHLKPMTILALNTGLRRGELFNLRRESVDFVRRTLTVEGITAKSVRTRHIPLNDSAFDTLSRWVNQNDARGLVFPGPGGKRMSHISTSWERLMKDAKIENFRFHDCRHDFASQLVMSGVDLNTVRELLGHSDIKMTLRYAHLAPAKLAAAVAKLGASR